MDLSAVNTPLAGFAAGLVTSIHCMGMCGPLACALLSPRGSSGSAHSSIAIYHGARILSYSTIGLVAGATGAAVAGLFSLGFAQVLPWAFIALFVVLLFGWEKRIPKIPYLSALFFRIRLRGSQMKQPTLAATLGIFTPFLPCAPLYLLFGVALLTGSALEGGKLMAAFAVGTAAPLWLLQSQYIRLQAKLSPMTMRRIQKTLAVASILLISWRAFSIGDVSTAEIPSANCPFH
jgi:uncharacterized protein